MPYVLSTAWIKPGKTQALKDWYAELTSRPEEVLETLENEGVRQEAAFILPTEHGDLLAVFIEVDDMNAANEAYYSSPFELDRQHAQAMEECTIGGSRGRIEAELMYDFQNPKREADVEA
jgi:Family of unknown function (DUF6176)